MEDLNHDKNNKYLCKNHAKKGILFRLMNSITKSFSRINLLRYSRNSLSFSTIFFSVSVLFFSCSLHSPPPPLSFLYLRYFHLKDVLSLYSWRYSCLQWALPSSFSWWNETFRAFCTIQVSHSVINVTLPSRWASLM